MTSLKEMIEMRLTSRIVHTFQSFWTLSYYLEFKLLCKFVLCC